MAILRVLEALTPQVRAGTVAPLPVVHRSRTRRRESMVFFRWQGKIVRSLPSWFQQPSGRSVSNVSTKSQHAKSSQSLSIASPAQRSVSGPGPMSPPTHSHLHNTTFASRQRTTSTVIGGFLYYVVGQASRRYAHTIRNKKDVICIW